MGFRLFKGYDNSGITPQRNFGRFTPNATQERSRPHGAGMHLEAGLKDPNFNLVGGSVGVTGAQATCRGGCGWDP